MTNRKTTRRALVTSIISLLLCVSMLVGTTFAWFTDSVTSGRNQIVAGNLDVVLEYWDGDSWEEVTETTNLFKEGALWEPGYTEVIYLRVSNDGTLALKYQLGINIISEKTAINVDNETFKLSDYIEFGAIETTDKNIYDTRDDARKAVTEGKIISEGYGKSSQLMPKDKGTSEEYVALVVYMPEKVGNEANYRGERPEITLGLNLLATQLVAENDSFNNEYDEDAVYGDAYVTNAAELQTAIDEADSGDTIVLMNDVELGGATTYAARAAAQYGITIPVGKDVTLNLNGHSVTGVTSETGKNQVLFTVKGSLAVTGEGTVSVSHVGENMAWNNLTAAFSVEGGSLTLNEGVTVINHGGSDMAYAVDVNTTLGASTLNVNGATLYSSYIGVRIFNNHKTAKGTVNFNSGVIQGAKNGYDIWAQLMSCPAENAVVNFADGISYTTADLSGTMYYINDGFTLISGADAVAEALTEGGTVTLLDDVQLDENTKLIVNSGVETVIDLNGHTLSVESTTTATHNFMIDVKGGELTLKNGTVSMEHTGTNMGWNGAATVIDVTAGGVLNLEGVVVENKGGTDMNFGVHLNNWGTATLNANNCVFKSSYCGVRVFNSGPDMNNVKITNSTLTGGTRAFWVHNYASADLGGKVYSGASVAYDKAAVDARLNLDIYNNNNTFKITGTAISPIRYGFNDSVYYDESGNVVEMVSTAAELQAALDAATGKKAIILSADITGDVTVTQKADVNIVIDGNGKKFTGVMTTFGNGRQGGAETLTIQNVNFVAADGADSCIVSPDRSVNNKYSYAHNVTVANCTFTDPDGVVNCAAIRHKDGGDKNWTITDCTVDSTMHSILQTNNVVGKLTISDCKVYSKNGANINCCTDVEITVCTFGVTGYAVRFGVSSGGNLGEAKTFLIKGSTLKSDCGDGDAIIMFRASAVDAVLTLDNCTLTGTTEISGNTSATTIITK